MHELSLAISILEIVTDEISGRFGRDAAARGTLESVTVRIGNLSGVEPETLLFAWETVRAESPSAGAKLEIVPVPIRARCSGCGGVFGIDLDVGDRGMRGMGGGSARGCPACGETVPFEIVEGREIEVARITWQERERVEI